MSQVEPRYHQDPKPSGTFLTTCFQCQFCHDNVFQIVPIKLMIRQNYVSFDTVSTNLLEALCYVFSLV